MTLKTQLDAFRETFMTKVPTEIRDAMTRADLELAASGAIDRALKAGERAPDFELPDAEGRPVRLASLLANGPVVLSFYRGGWCPYCNLELRALQAALPEIKAVGGTLVAISPERPDESLSTAERNGLQFPVLSDVGSRVAAAYGLSFPLAAQLRPIYTNFGHALPDRNGDSSWTLPVPATYVIDPSGMVTLAFVDVDYRNRLEPQEIVNALRVASLAEVR